MNDASKVAVIGAGPCGLVASKALAEAGLEVETFEAGERIGGVWDLDRQPSGAYRSLHTNTSTRMMAFSDFPFPAGSSTHPSAAELRGYFEAYARHFDLGPRIRLGQRVVRARPRASGGWRIEVEGAGEERVYRALVVATGQYAVPRWPSPGVPGRFAGERLHSFDYFDPRTPVDCRGKRVVVVGLGSTAAELAAELSDPKASLGRAERVFLSARSGRWVLPKTIDGAPVDANAPHAADPIPDALVPLSYEERIQTVKALMGPGFRALAGKVGAYDALGLPEPTLEPWDERPTLSSEFLPALREGRIDVRPDIVGFDGHRIRFRDGSHVEADVVLYATGYQRSLPFLDEGVLGGDAESLALYRQIVHPVHADLFFVGFLRVTCSMWPVAEQQSDWIARHLSGGFALPDAAERRREAEPLARSEPVFCSLYADRLRQQGRAPG